MENRIIKFRCWQKKFDDEWEMIQAEDLAFDTYKPLVDLLENDPDSEIFMQFTGLKDKNGKEIYEGDIVKKYYKGKWVYLIIVWNPLGMWSVKWNDDYVNNFYMNGLSLEIVGNIYENKDLL